VPTKCFIPSLNISLSPAYAHKLKTLSNIATLANITRHKERSMDTYLFQISNKLLIHGIWLQLIPSDPGSFRSCHSLWHQKSLQHFKCSQYLSWICTSWKLYHWKTRKASPSLAPLTKFGSVATPDQLVVYMTMGKNSSLPNFKNFFNHMEFNPNWPLSKTLKPKVSLKAPIK
jgi:hypothetical protein